MKLAVMLSCLMTIHMSQCGRVRRQSVAGEQCKTPFKHNGDCRIMEECQALLNISRESKEEFIESASAFVRDSRCGDSSLFCCPHLCGKGIKIGKVEQTDRIVHGDDATLGAWPWMAVLGYSSTSWEGLKWQCGGTLVTERHVITAAHCVVIRGDTTLKIVRLGDLNLKDDIEDGASPVDMEVDSLVPHRSFRSGYKKDDIAIVKMKDRVTFSRLIQSICLPNSTILGSLVGKSTYVAGWGALLFEGPSSNALQDADVVVTSEESCRKAYDATLWNGPIDQRVICAGNGTKDSCQGDSGGPLMYEHDDSFYLVGVVSYGKDCATPGYPGVYMRVSAFMDWINETIFPFSV